jgi:hypothetical protein
MLPLGGLHGKHAVQHEIWVQTQHMTDANIVMGAESADFFFDCWYLKVITDDGI